MILLENVECICHEQNASPLLIAFPGCSPGLSPPSVVGSSVGTGAGHVCVLSLSASPLQGISPGCTWASFAYRFCGFTLLLCIGSLSMENQLARVKTPSEFHAVLQHHKEEIIFFFRKRRFKVIAEVFATLRIKFSHTHISS